ncbi:hypothetical protein ASPWEDRAFT_66343 [Aspergillus wentii DTO 134E9]|uniref:Pentacotripeptide-repeat region of PRORP domain-containing protein n=1 Tax=Aspergillus wentii DTO 134E9 TaxID=1073089 RepID=A0A1L9RX66_ASPWE|nr:uncharacterized protein ASPWEDRAFT_66343 [Aspergillus wentii DTO 134E9]OJJ39519.1 hypothetical protein ASPWEDRAFT_66343 [Aspergillus wentii DTO 134E9]
MLERAAGCLENAGRRFFRDSNGAVRAPRSIYPHVQGKFNGASTECPQWLLVLLQTSDQRVPTPNPDRVASDTRTPFLDFLYPLRTQEFAASCILRPLKRIIPRRRRKALPNLTRTYASNATSVSQPAGVDKSVLDGATSGKDRKRANDSLKGLLGKEGLPDHERAWTLYVAAGHPVDLNSALLVYLSTAERVVDHNRAKRLFDGIPAKSRTDGDYLQLAKSYLAAGKVSEMKTVCEEAISGNIGISCWSFTFAHFVKNSQWDLARETWDLKLEPLQNEWLHHAFLHFDASSVTNSIYNLAIFLQGQAHDSPVRELARSLLTHAFSSSSLVESMSTETMLFLLRKFNDLGVLTPDHYFSLMGALQSSKARSTFIRSIVIYRNFRWQMESEVPPAKVLGLFLRSLASFEITSGIQYFLDEFAHFHGKPSIDAYKSGLIAFSRAGDVVQVNDIFDRLVADHGKPLSRRLLTPLLHVHARVGNVRETLRQFERISKEFGLEPNTVCWNILLSAHANANDVNSSLSTFEQMLSKGIEPNAHTFGTIMGLCANRGDIDTVRNLLVLAKKRQVQITAPLLDTIVEAYCNNRNLDMAESVAETCFGLEVKGSRLRMWNMLLWNHAFRMDLEAVSRIRSRMEAAGLQPDGMTYGALMLSLVLIGQPDAARRILRTLHRSRRMYATEFHYAIILYGYVKSRNRDMVHIIFREIQERFNRPGFSSRLLVLKSQLQRDLELIKSDGKPVTGANVRLENAEKFLADTIANFDPTKYATKEPVPGAGKQPINQAFPAMYYEYVISAYGTRGASEKVRELFDQFTSGQQSLSPTDQAYDAAPLRMLSALMLTYLKADQYKKVEACWKLAFPRAVKMASRPDTDIWVSTRVEFPDSPEPPRPSLPSSAPGQNNLLVSSKDQQALYNENQHSILSSCRFLLSRPLSLYMRSLAYRNEAWRIPKLVAKIEQEGFSMTTFNWSTYVQMLASSDRPSDQIEAFTLFERKFMPNFPGWKHLQRGYGIRPPGVPSTIDAIENPTRRKNPRVLGKQGRKYWSKVQPDFMQPTYISMVYLASSLNRFRERSIYDGGAELYALHSTAPTTVAAIAEMPYLREKFQGVLLRRREEQGDRADDLERYEQFVWTGGILGVGGKPRPITDVEHPSPETSESDKTTPEERNQMSLDSKAAQAFGVSRNREAGVADSSPEDIVTPPEKTLDYQDEYDIEAESLLESRRRSSAMDDESLDNERRSKRTYEGHQLLLTTLLEGTPSSTPGATGTARQFRRSRRR